MALPLLALGIPAAWVAGRAFLASRAGTAAIGTAGGYLWGQQTAQPPSIWPSSMQLFGMAAATLAFVLLIQQWRRLRR